MPVKKNVLTRKSSKRSAKRSPKPSAKRSPKRSAKRSPKRSAKRSPKRSTKRSPKRSTKRSPKPSTKRSPKPSTKRSTKRSPSKKNRRTMKFTMLNQNVNPLRKIAVCGKFTKPETCEKRLDCEYDMDKKKCRRRQEVREGPELPMFYNF